VDLGFTEGSKMHEKWTWCEPIDQSTNQSICQSTYQSITQSSNQSIDQSINQSIDRSFHVVSFGVVPFNAVWFRVMHISLRMPGCMDLVALVRYTLQWDRSESYSHGQVRLPVGKFSDVDLLSVRKWPCDSDFKSLAIWALDLCVSRV